MILEDGRIFRKVGLRRAPADRTGRGVEVARGLHDASVDRERWPCLVMGAEQKRGVGGGGDLIDAEREAIDLTASPRDRSPARALRPSREDDFQRRVVDRGVKSGSPARPRAGPAATVWRPRGCAP